MRHRYGALPVVPKIFYKQNSRDNAKGADSVHITVEPGGGDFRLWFGESKFYNSIEDARLPSIVDSVKNALATDKLKKENSIITNVSDLGSLAIAHELREAIKAALSSKESIDSIKPRLSVAILLLHECSLTSSATSLSVEYIEAIRDHHRDRAVAYFSRQITELKDLYLYSQIQFHLILFPVPDKERIVKEYLTYAEAQRG